MLPVDIDANAKILWDYLKLNQKLHKCSGIIALGSSDIRTAQRAADLYNKKYGDYIVVSGGLGKVTAQTSKISEAETFRKSIIDKGVPNKKVLLEDQSTNSGENASLTYKLLANLGYNIDTLLLVHKPYMERRAYATFMAQWPDKMTKFLVTSPTLKYEDYFNDDNPKQRAINLMVGDLQRIKEYSSKGFQVEQRIPEKVRRAYKSLVKLGFDEYVMKTDTIRP